MNRYELRKLTVDDLKLVLNWRNKENIRLNMINPEKISWEEHHNWFEGLKNKKDRQVLVFFINDKPMGLVSFVDILKDSCSWGFYIGEELAPKGAGLMLGYQAIEYAFNNYKIEKIDSQVIGFNKASIGFHEKLFFNHKCIEEKALLRDGIYYDLLIFELLRETWLTVKEKVFSQALAKVEGRN